MLGVIDRKLEAMGYPLDRVAGPGAIYTPVVVDGTTIYTAGAIANDGDKLVSKGKVPSQVPLADAQKAAALCAANILRNVRKVIGTLDRIERVLRLMGYVNTDPDFTDQHLVINGASQFLVDLFGESGMHARTAIGVYVLPRGSSVEVDMVLKLRSS